jgi:hypothetical protein
MFLPAAYHQCSSVEGSTSSRPQLFTVFLATKSEKQENIQNILTYTGTGTGTGMTELQNVSMNRAYGVTGNVPRYVDKV